jgi:hypothetical protein
MFPVFRGFSHVHGNEWFSQPLTQLWGPVLVCPVFGGIKCPYLNTPRLTRR